MTLTTAQIKISSELSRVDIGEYLEFPAKYKRSMEALERKGLPIRIDKSEKLWAICRTS